MYKTIAADPPVSNPTRINNTSNGKHGSRLNISAVLIPTLGDSNPSPVEISNLRRNLEALLGPRLNVGARKFGKLAPLKILPVSARRCLVS